MLTALWSKLFLLYNFCTFWNWLSGGDLGLPLPFRSGADVEYSIDIVRWLPQRPCWFMFHSVMCHICRYVAQLVWGTLLVHNPDIVIGLLLTLRFTSCFVESNLVYILCRETATACLWPLYEYVRHRGHCWNTVRIINKSLKDNDHGCMESCTQLIQI